MLRAAQIEERFRAEIRRRGEAQADVRQVGPHIVQQEVGVGGKLLVAQGLDWAVPGAQGGDVAGRAPDLGEEVAAVRSEERRVGKECRSRGSTEREKNKLESAHRRCDTD